MFFIMGISNGEKRLNFDQLEICTCCGAYGHIQIYMTYLCFTFFFIPIFKWERKYQVRMSCCGSSCEISSDLGKAIERGEIQRLNIKDLHFGFKGHRMKRCMNCGFTTEEDFEFCPKCGKNL